MNGLVFHVVSGHAFFTGISMLVLAALVVEVGAKPIWIRLSSLLFVVGLVAVVVSSTAVPFWCCIVTIVSTLGWLVARHRKQWSRTVAVLFCCSWIMAGVLELPWHMMPALHPVSSRSITVIGDSVTSGVGGDETSKTWPSLLATQYQVSVQDISHVGETTASALKRAAKQEIDSELVVVEIGGNDILGGTTAARFGTDLEALLKHLSQPNRQIVLLELPLPPLCHEFGRQQRLAAAKYGGALVPKRIFLNVLADSESTIDSIHLSQIGHQLMADTIWSIVGTAFQPATN